MSLKLTQLARKSIESYFQGKKFEPDVETKKKYSEKGACFITLTLNGNLRGCIGSLEAHRELWKDVCENAVNSAFNDYRFVPLKKEELSKIKIEVSVLSKAIKLGLGEKVFPKINNKMGIILKKGFNTATFLPQVWEQLPDKTEFLKELSLKAGLNANDWKTAEISYYTIKSEEE